MSLTLAALSRNGTRVLLTDNYTWLQFRAPDDVVRYLRFWITDAGAMADLRNALSRYRRGPIAGMSDDEVINALAVHVARRELVLVELAMMPTAFGTTDAAAPPTPASALAAPSLPAVLAPLALPAGPLLLLLEEVQIEGAQVLPEVLETLEQLDLSMGKMELATVSLAPAPSGVPAISSAMQAASSSITSTLDGL